MAANDNRTPFTLVLLLAIVLQAIFAVADSRETPHRAAVLFSQAYFGLDPAMGAFLCNASLGENEIAVARHFQKADHEARLRGYPPSMLKSGLYNVETHTLSRTEQAATVRLSAEKRSAINPVFAYVAKLFNLSGAEKIEATLDLVKQDGKWKVCGQPFDLPQA